jgi:hypothetical protein
VADVSRMADVNRVALFFCRPDLGRRMLEEGSEALVNAGIGCGPVGCEPDGSGGSGSLQGFEVRLGGTDADRGSRAGRRRRRSERGLSGMGEDGGGRGRPGGWRLNRCGHHGEGSDGTVCAPGGCGAGRGFSGRGKRERLGEWREARGRRRVGFGAGAESLRLSKR